MNQSYANNNEIVENVPAGVVGALLGALAGGALYFLLSLVGIISALSGLIGVVLAAKGYVWLSKKESVKGVVIAAVLALLAIVLGWYLVLTKDVYQACKIWYKDGDIEFMPTFADCFRMAPEFLKDKEIATPYFTDLALGILFAVVGGISYIINSIKRIKAQNAQAAAQNVVYVNQAPFGTVNSDPDSAGTYTQYQEVNNDTIYKDGQ